MVKRYICRDCGTISKGKVVRWGSFATETGLWIAFLLGLFFYVAFPLFGVIHFIICCVYSGKRLFSRSWIECKECKSTGLLPTNTPGGQTVARQFGTDLTPPKTVTTSKGSVI